jgi:hypothetical protein
MAANAGTAASESETWVNPEAWVTYPIDLDVGEVADGYHLIVRSISLSARDLTSSSRSSPNAPRERTSG